MTFLRSVVLLMVVLVLGQPAVAQAQRDVLGGPAGVGTVAQWGGVRAWSEPTGAAGQWGVWVQQRGTRRLVLERFTPVDLDVGPDERGRPQLAFSRCGNQGSLTLSAAAFDLTGRGEPSPVGCKVSLLDLGTLRERVLDLGQGRSTYRPTVWRSTIAYAETRDGSLTTRIVVRDLKTRRVIRTVARPRGLCTPRPALAPVVTSPVCGLGPTELDLGARLLAAHWQRRTSPDAGQAEIFTVRLSDGTTRVHDTRTISARAGLVGPQLIGDTIAWARTGTNPGVLSRSSQRAARTIRRSAPQFFAERLRPIDIAFGARPDRLFVYGARVTTRYSCGRIQTAAPPLNVRGDCELLVENR